MSDRRQKRQQRLRQDAGVSPLPRDGDRKSQPGALPRVQNAGSSVINAPGNSVAYAEPKQYESVTIMPDKIEKQDKETGSSKKYRRREILSNWCRYEDLPTDQPGGEENYMLGEDFSQILQQQTLGGNAGYFRLKEEALWDETEISLSMSHGMGSLHLTDLAAAVNTIPLHIQLNISADSLPKDLVQFYTQLADDNRKLYTPNQEYKTDLDVSEKILQSLKLSDNEVFDLTNNNADYSENTSSKSSIDIALSLASAFGATTNGEENVDYSVIDCALEEVPSISTEFVKPVLSPATSTHNVTLHKPSIPTEIPVINMKNESNLVKKGNEFNFGLPKTETANIQETNITSSNSSLLENKEYTTLKVNETNVPINKDEFIEAPVIDLDAPIISSKPVLLVNKTEISVLEDWLDSVLGD